MSQAGATSDRAATAVVTALARGALGEGYDPDVPARMLSYVAGLPSAGDRKQVLSAMKALNTRAGALALTGSATPVSWLSATEAEALITRWKNSRLETRRRLAAVVTGLAGLSLYGYSQKEWDRIGYPGPLGPAPDEPKRLQPLEITGEQTLACDVVIVGSGAGGGCVAAGLSAAGFDVVVLEKGGYRSERDFHHREPDAMRELYLYGSMLTTSDLGVRVIAGSTLGGGTVVNYTTAFRTPEHVLKQWTEESGIDDFASGAFDESLDEVSERLGVNTDSSAAGKRDELMEEGLKKLGWHVDQMPRAVRGCTQDERCGYCGFGCRVGAKQSTMRTYLEDAAAAGTRIVVDCDVRRVLISAGRATGVEATIRGRKLNVLARAVVVAAGAIESPALLLRSGLRGQVGHNLHLHPGTAAWGIFDEDVRTWEGTLQARYSNEFRHWDGGYGPIFETVPIHAGAAASAFPWQSALHHREMMAKYRNISFCAVLPRDTTGGRIKIDRQGIPKIDYTLNSDDLRRLTEGVVQAARVMEAAGAVEVNSPHQLPIGYLTGNGGHAAWADEVRAKGLKGNTTFFSYHQMGSCRMGTNPSRSAIDTNNESHEVKNLFVTDGSAFPTASGVNPMLSIYGIANRAAKRIAAKLA
jgi:choline dehydrogenase-like flavoprotein